MLKKFVPFILIILLVTLGACKNQTKDLSKKEDLLLFTRMENESTGITTNWNKSTVFKVSKGQAITFTVVLYNNSSKTIKNVLAEGSLPKSLVLIKSNKKDFALKIPPIKPKSKRFFLVKAIVQEDILGKVLGFQTEIKYKGRKIGKSRLYLYVQKNVL